MYVRTVFISLAAALAAGIGVNAAAAQSSGTQSFAATFEEVSNSCRDRRLPLKSATIILTVRVDDLDVSIPGLPLMSGTMRRGKLRVAATRKESGVESRFSAVGRAGERQVQLVLVAEYYRGAEPECAQSWNVVGTRK